MALTSEQRSRYARHLSLAPIGEKGQELLLRGRVLLIGVGGLGSPIALYLAAAGVGTIGIVDADVVDASNLQRQVLFTTADIGHAKAAVAAERLKALNPDVDVVTHETWFSADNADTLIADYDFVIDATDNFDAKFLIADTCHHTGTPYSHAGIDQFFGQTITVRPGDSTCYRCLFSAPPVDTGDGPRGPLGVVPGVIGTVQASEAIKHLTGSGELLTNRLFTYNALRTSVRIIPVKPNPDCPLCGQHGVPRTERD